MKTLTKTCGFLAVMLGTIVANTSDAGYSSKPWLQSGQGGFPQTVAADRVPTGTFLQAAAGTAAYNSKPWQRPRQAYEIGLFPAEQPVVAGQGPAYRKTWPPSPPVQDWGSKPWLKLSEFQAPHQH